jgi:ribonuclease D
VYAALDVELLVDLREALGRILDEAGKSELAAEEFQSVLERDFVVVRNEPWRRLSGVHSLRNPRNLAVARELWLARDEFARDIDTAPGRLIPDASLVAAAKALPQSKRELAGLKEFSGRASRTQLDRWWAAIQSGMATDDLPKLRVGGESIPPPRVWAEKNPEGDKRLKLAREAVGGVATELNIPLENVLTPDLLRRVAWSPPEPLDVTTIGSTLFDLGARPWQVDATAQVIHDAFVEAHQPLEATSEGDS